jgi:hypothetical protein
MLATLAALQLVLLSQVSGPPRLVTPDDASLAEEEGASAPQEPETTDAGPPDEGRPPGTIPPPAEPPEGELPRKPDRPATAAGQAAKPGRPPQQSLLSAEPLRGGSAALAWAGWSELGAEYAIGFTERDDGGVYLSYDWAKSENRIGLLYRRPLAKAGAFDMAGRLAIAWYVNFGSDYIYDENHSDRGFEVVPALALSRRAAGGIFSVLGEAPMTVTMKYSAGFLFSPRVSLAYETPLYPAVTVGARVGLGYRAGAGDAPLKDGRGEVQFLVLAGYQLL